MQEQSLTPLAPRDTGWKKDGKARGIYWRKRTSGSKRWGYYVDGTIIGATSRRAAIDGKARATLRKDVSVRPPSTGVRICDLAAEVREAKRRKLRDWSFTCFERALDKVLLPELGHLKPAQAGPDRIARLIQDLEEEGLSPSSIRRYLSPLGPIFKLAMRRGLLTSSPLELLLDDERPRGGGIRKHYVWSAAEVSALIAAADELGRRPEANYNYAPLIQLLVLTGLRVGEALALAVGKRRPRSGRAPRPGIAGPHGRAESTEDGGRRPHRPPLARTHRSARPAQAGSVPPRRSSCSPRPEAAARSPTGTSADEASTRQSKQRASPDVASRSTASEAPPRAS